MSAVLAVDSSTRNAYVAVERDGRIAAQEAVTAQDLVTPAGPGAGGRAPPV